MRLRACGLLAVMAVLTALSTRAQATETLRVAYEDRPLPPYYLGESAEVDPVKPGLSVELVQMAGRQLEVELQLVRMPWTRCLASLQKGEVDAVFNASFKEERQENGVYPLRDGKPDASRRIATVAYSLYRAKGGAVAWNGTAITGVTGVVGAPAGYSIIDDLTKMGIKVESAPDTQSNFKKLASGRAQAVATLDVIGDALLASGEFPTIEKLSPPLVTKDYFVMVSHQFYAAHRPLAERLWSTVADLRESRGAELRTKYGR